MDQKHIYECSLWASWLRGWSLDALNSIAFGNGPSGANRQRLPIDNCPAAGKMKRVSALSCAVDYPKPLFICVLRFYGMAQKRVSSRIVCL